MPPKKRVCLRLHEPEFSPLLNRAPADPGVQFCPNCQMPFSILTVQTKTWHMTECLEVDRTVQLECSMGSECDSTIVNHYLSKTHYELAAHRCGIKTDDLSRIQMQKTVVTLPDNTSATVRNHRVRGSSSQTKITSFFGAPVASAVTRTLSGATKSTDSEKGVKQSPNHGDPRKRAPIFDRNGFKPEKEIQTDVSPLATNRTCPRYKKLPDVPFVVDAFKYGDIQGISAYFLSHFHYDHYCGLSNKFRKHLYCSQVTANLVNLHFRIPSRFVHPLPIDEPRTMHGIEVTLVEANHCPGAVMFLFRYTNGRTVLHTGDFRADDKMERNVALAVPQIDDLYLDTTYCHRSYDFPKQAEILNFVVEVSKKHLEERPRDLIVCGSYTIGKEKVFTAIARNLHVNVWADSSKRRILKCLNDRIIDELLTDDVGRAQIHVLRMDQICFKVIAEGYLTTMSKHYTGILALKPTGWEHSLNKRSDPSGLKRPLVVPRKHGNITIYGVSYSEHSSFSELKRFVQLTRPRNVIPTVNVVGDKAKQQMEIIKSWMTS